MCCSPPLFRQEPFPMTSLNTTEWLAIFIVIITLRAASNASDEPFPTREKQKVNFKRKIHGIPPEKNHWSFIQPNRPQLPRLSDLTWSRNAIDVFILARLGNAGFEVSGKASLRTLIRRLSLDLIGIPPTSNGVDRVINDKRPDTYQRYVDRLLASPHYGERMALDWLDAARFADTHGYSIDSGRTMWPWRDWVVNAYNQNMPFDQFTIQQVAGDLLPGATQDQWVATGFNRNHMINFEGGAIPEEYRVEYVVDRVNTTATVWMGLTIGCARCHDHKYDPITQKDFYRLFAFFNTIRDMGLDGAQDNAQPVMLVPNEFQQERLRILSEKTREIEFQLDDDHAGWDEAQRNWEKQVRQGNDVTIALGDWHSLGPFTEQPHFRLLGRNFGPEGIPVNIDQDVRFNDHRRWQVHRWQPRPDWIDGLFYELPGDAAATYLFRNINASRCQEVSLSVSSAFGWKVFLNEEEVFQVQDHREPAPDQYRIQLKLQPGDNALLCKVINYGGPYGFEAALRTMEPSLVLPPSYLQETIRKSSATRTPAQLRNLRRFFRTCVSVERDLRDVLDQRAAIHQEINDVRNTIPTTMVMRESLTPPETFLLQRGDYQQPAERLEPGTPTTLPPLPIGAPANRLGFAQWLTAPEHPLTARVAVNRCWQMVFGTGIVKTAGDFGAQGQYPSHPNLLDWLATEFMHSGWNVKHLIRLIVTSATYQQSSTVTPELRVRDPENRLLARGPRFRIQAELLRDCALAVSHLLNDTVGGPSVKPYQPSGLWKEISFSPDSTRFSEQAYQTDRGANVHRRSLYTFWKRSAPPPNMTAFDAPNREVCTTSRPRTNTPMQALVLLNDPTFVESARALAERMLKEGGSTPQQRIQFGFLVATSRPATKRELRILTGEYERQYQSFRLEREAAEKLLEIGQSKRDTLLDVIEHAAWTNVAGVILNLDEVLTKG